MALTIYPKFCEDGNKCTQSTRKAKKEFGKRLSKEVKEKSQSFYVMRSTLYYVRNRFQTTIKEKLQKEK